MASGEATNHRVTIFIHGGKAKVWPPYVTALPKDTITFSTINTEARITLPNRHAFATHDKLYYMEHDTRGGIDLKEGEAVTLDLKDTISKMLEEFPVDSRGNMVTEKGAQTYAYTVFCVTANDYAEGNSSPVIFIEPPPKGGG